MRFIKRLLFIVLLAILGAAAWLAWFAGAALVLRTSPLDFDIAPGLSLHAAARQMSSAGMGFSPWQFTLLARLAGKSGEIKAGSYEVTQGVTPWRLLGKLTRGDVTQAEVVFVEGKTFRELRAVLDANPDIRHDTVGLSDAEILAKIGAVEKYPEGLFFPDTYLFAKNSSDLDILKRAYHAMQRHLDTEWQRRSPDLPLASPYQALILASIIEKETGRPADRAPVAAVFVNRLRLGMPLQTDPTVIYGAGAKLQGGLLKRNLQIDTPYNTYTRNGLPPTPIAMPGLASLQAALHPPASTMLYFVARGDGSSQFSRTLEEHNRAVAKYLKGK